MRAELAELRSLGWSVARANSPHPLLWEPSKDESTAPTATILRLEEMVVVHEPLGHVVVGIYQGYGVLRRLLDETRQHTDEAATDSVCWTITHRPELDTESVSLAAASVRALADQCGCTPAEAAEALTKALSIEVES